jgi:hypothetical protein
LEMPTVAGILLLPETRDDWISNVSGHPLAEFVFCIEARQINEARSRAREERSDAVIKEVFKPRSPTVPPQVLECGNHPPRRAAGAREKYQQAVEPHRKFGVGDVGRRLAESGASSKMVMAVLGHRTLSEVERYTEDADQVGLALEAVSKLEGHKWNEIAQTSSDGLGKTAKTDGESK